MPDLIQQHAWPSGTSRRLQILCDGFDPRLEPIAFVFPEATGQLSAQAHFAVLPQLLLNFEFNLPTEEKQPKYVEQLLP